MKRARNLKAIIAPTNTSAPPVTNRVVGTAPRAAASRRRGSAPLVILVIKRHALKCHRAISPGICACPQSARAHNPIPHDHLHLLSSPIRHLRDQPEPTVRFVSDRLLHLPPLRDDSLHCVCVCVCAALALSCTCELSRSAVYMLSRVEHARKCKGRLTVHARPCGRDQRAAFRRRDWCSCKRRRLPRRARAPPAAGRC